MCAWLLLEQAIITSSNTWDCRLLLPVAALLGFRLSERTADFPPCYGNSGKARALNTCVPYGFSIWRKSDTFNMHLPAAGRRRVRLLLCVFSISCLWRRAADRALFAVAGVFCGAVGASCMLKYFTPREDSMALALSPRPTSPPQQNFSLICGISPVTTDAAHFPLAKAKNSSAGGREH